MMVSDIDMIYAAHRALLTRVEQAATPAELVGDTEILIEQVRRAGSSISAPAERDYLQSLLTFWGNWTYKQTRVYPNTDLYPAAPGAWESRVSGTENDGLLARPFQTFAAGEAPPGAVRALGTGQPFIMATLVSPADGASVRVSEAVSLVGLYANLRPAYTLFIVTQDAIGRLTALDGGFSPVEHPAGGSWQGAQPFVPGEAGVYRLGIVLAITPDATAALSDAFTAGRALESTPIGAVPFLDLVAITAQPQGD
jgi:hypothetical protein